MKQTNSFKKAIALTLAIGMVVAAVPSNSADAKGKVALNKTDATIAVGNTVKIKVKNGVKKAKVTWKTSKKSVASISKKNTKGKTAYAVIKGVSAGKAKITASYKLGKKTKTLKCNVKVTAASVNVTTAPVATSVATTAPIPTATVSADTSTAVPTKTPTPTKKPTATPVPTPTPIPDDYASEISSALDFESRYDTGDCKSSVKDGILTFAEGEASTLLNLPGCVQADGEYAPAGAYIIVYVKGNYTGENGFALEVGNGWESYLEPDKKMVSDKKQFVFPADHEQGEFSEVFYGKYSDPLSGFGIKSLDGKSATGVEIKEIKVQFCGFPPKFTENNELIVPGKEPYDGYIGVFKIPFKTDKKTDDVVGTEIMVNDCSNGHRNGSLNLFAPGRNEGSDYKEPYFSVALFGDLILKDTLPVEEVLPAKTAYATKIDKELTIDEEGNVALDEVWNTITEIKITDFTLFDAEYADAKQSVTDASVKFAWTAKNLYILVKVTDPDFENVPENQESFQRDSLEIYFDEVREKDTEGNVIADYDADSFQYRLPYNNSPETDRGRNYADSGYEVESTTKFFRLPAAD